MGLNPLDAKPRARVSRVTYASVAHWLEEDQEGRWVAAVLAAAAGADRAGRPSRPRTGPPRPGPAASGLSRRRPSPGARRPRPNSFPARSSGLLLST